MMKRQFTRDEWKAIVRRALINLKCDQRELAQFIGIGETTVSQWLSNGNHPRKLCHIEAVLKYAGENTGLIPDESESEINRPVNRLDIAGQIAIELKRIRNILTVIADRITIADDINSRIRLLELEADRRERRKAG